MRVELQNIKGFNVFAEQLRTRMCSRFEVLLLRGQLPNTASICRDQSTKGIRSCGGLNGTCKLLAAATTLKQHPLDIHTC